MAGFIVNLAKALQRLNLYIESGIYGTRISPSAARRKVNLMTLADYVIMRPGDLIFFFQDRLIYGIGEITGFEFTDKPCVLCNFPNSYILDHPAKEPYLWNEDKDPTIRWRIFFQPYPCFFKQGVDMDEVLQSDTNKVVRALPLFWNRSFLNVEDDEANLIAQTILRRNKGRDSDVFMNRSQITRSLVREKLKTLDFTLNLDDFVNYYSSLNDFPEAALQVWLVGNLALRMPTVTKIFGNWDYICNLYPASPVKPRAYVDEIDVFGYSLAEAPKGIRPYIQTFKIIEIKVDPQSYRPPNVVDQVMKYVDWISITRAGGDYGQVEAYVVAKDFDERLVQYVREQAVRRYITPRRPYTTNEWNNLKLVRYHLTGKTPAIELEFMA